MVANHESHKDHLSVRDDGWWASVLADEERYAPPAPSRPPKNNLQAGELPKWRRAQTLFHNDEVITMRATGFNRGGLLVEGDGLHGFVPFSHLVEMAGRNDIENREKILAAYVGRLLNLKVIECVPEDGRVVFSERAAQAGAGRRAELFETLQPGQRIWGEVTNITDFGVFVDLGGVEGLIHISELSWGRVSHPGQVVQLGQRVEVQVMEVLPERCRVALSLKRLFDNPWETVESNYAADQIVSAVITSIVPFGAFARLDTGLEGLIHISEMPLTVGMSVDGFLSTGQRVQVRILHVDAAHQRLGLSLRLNEENAS